MNEETSDLQPPKNNAGISEQLFTPLGREKKSPRRNLPNYMLRSFCLKQLRGLLKKVLQVSRSSKLNPDAVVPVYDIINCGPRNRFATVGTIAHNCLALGYGAGWEKFITMAHNYISDSEFDAIFKVKPSDADRAKFYTYLVSQEKRKVGGVAKFNAATEEDQWVCVNAWLQVTDYRKSNSKITDFWETLDRTFKMSAGKDCTIALPNGREMKYRGIEVRGGSTTCVQVRQGAWMRTKLYGGLGAENICQSLARDVFMDCVYRILKAGHKIILRVHDEVVIECDEDKAAQVLAEVSEIMHTAPSWIASLPLASEGMITKVYKK